jgi:hypothetical protein
MIQKKARKNALSLLVIWKRRSHIFLSNTCSIREWRRTPCSCSLCLFSLKSEDDEMLLLPPRAPLLIQKESDARQRFSDKRGQERLSGLQKYIPLLCCSQVTRAQSSSSSNRYLFCETALYFISISDVYILRYFILAALMINYCI